MAIDRILEDFDFLDDWEDRYRYVIELGKKLPELDEELRTPATRVEGCVSQVWLHSSAEPNGSGGPVLVFQGDSDAHIVRGLIAILFEIYSGQQARKILETDPNQIFDRLGLRDHLTPQRSNGLNAMVERIKQDARSVIDNPVNAH